MWGPSPIRQSYSAQVPSSGRCRRGAAQSAPGAAAAFHGGAETTWAKPVSCLHRCPREPYPSKAGASIPHVRHLRLYVLLSNSDADSEPECAEFVRAVGRGRFPPARGGGGTIRVRCSGLGRTPPRQGREVLEREDLAYGTGSLQGGRAPELEWFESASQSSPSETLAPPVYDRHDDKGARGARAAASRRQEAIDAPLEVK